MYSFIRKILFILPMTAIACSEMSEISEPAPDPVRIDAFIAGVDDGESRTNMTGSTASFASGDNIGLFETLTGQSNFHYSYNGTAWSAVSPAFWRDAASTHTFYAYYPYNSVSSGTLASIPVLANQTIDRTPSAAMDLLVAGPLNQTRSSGVGLTFKHAFTLVQINIKMGILGLLNPYVLNNITVRGGNPSASASPYGIVNSTGNASNVGYNLVTGALQADSNTSARFAQSFTVHITGVSLLTTAVTLYFFVLPGTYTNPVPAISFNLSLLGLISNSTYANFANTTFLPGTKYSYDVSIGKLLLSPGTPAPALVPTKIVPYDHQPTNIE